MSKKEKDEAYKRQTVKHIKESGKSVAEIERELKINASTLYGWVSKDTKSKTLSFGCGARISFVILLNELTT